MKNRVRYYVVACILFLNIVCGCEPSNTEQKINIEYKTLPYRLDYGHIDLIIIDSCEYIRIYRGSQTWGSHKGNCTFCAERNKKKEFGKSKLI